MEADIGAKEEAEGDGFECMQSVFFAAVGVLTGNLGLSLAGIPDGLARKANNIRVCQS